MNPDPKPPLLTVSGQQFIIGFGVVSLWILVLVILAFVALPEANRDAFNLFLGGVLGAGTTVLAFYFPSSVGARSKDEAISKLAGALPPTATAPQP